jgi:3-dehydroquinate synthase
MRIDKKVKAGQVRFVLMHAIGKAFITAEYPAEALQQTLREHFA